MIQIRYAWIKEEDDSLLSAEVLSGVSPRWRAKVEQSGSAFSKQQRLATGHLLEGMLKECLPQREVESFSYGSSERGRPYLMDECGNVEKKVDFSISHTKGFCVCGVSSMTKESPLSHIGVDTESLQRFQKNVAQRFFTAEEQTFFSENPEMEKALFSYFWTGKEAIAKCLDIPLMLACSHVCLLPLLSGKEKRLVESGRWFEISLPHAFEDADRKNVAADVGSLQTLPDKLYLWYETVETYCIACAAASPVSVSFFHGGNH